MTTSGPYTERYDFRSAYDMTDLRGPLPKKVTDPQSIAGILERGEDTQLFSYILELSGLQGIYDSEEADVTLFVVPDCYLRHIESEITNLDRATARDIIKSNSLRRRIISALLESSRISYFYTTSPPNQLCVSNIAGITYVNDDATLIGKDVQANNGIIHYLDKLIVPCID